MYTDRKYETVRDVKEQDWKNGTERDRLYCFDDYGHRKCANGRQLHT